MRIFVDMDGTLAEWKTATAFEDLFEEGYFKSLMPHSNVVLALKSLIGEKGIEGFIDSHYLQDSRYALKEKNEWVDSMLPEIPRANRIFSPCGTDKSVHVPGGVKSTDILIDDYSPNLRIWEAAGGTGIKFMNGINGTKGTWSGARISKDDDVKKIIYTILQTMKEAQMRIEKGEIER